MEIILDSFRGSITPQRNNNCHCDGDCDCDNHCNCDENTCICDIQGPCPYSDECNDLGVCPNETA